jgi:sucrose porin
VGPGKLSLAAFSLDQGDFANSRQNPAPRTTEVECKTVHGMYDVTLGNTGIWKFEGAWHSAEHLEELDAWDDNDADSGWQGGIVNTRLDYYGHREADTFTVSMLQYGKKIGSNLGQACEYLDFNRSLDDDSEAIRFATYGVRPLGSKWNMMTAFIAEKRWDYFSEGDDLNWVSIGGRLQYKWTRNFILNIEPGYQWVEDANDESGGVFKFTIAPTFKMDTDSFWSRPEVRFFMTYATWSDDIEDQIVQPNGAPLTWAANYTDNWTLNFGIQAEIWWDYD